MKDFVNFNALSGQVHAAVIKSDGWLKPDILCTEIDVIELKAQHCIMTPATLIQMKFAQRLML